MRRVVEFEADFADDQIEKDGEILVFGGRSALQAIREAMITQGWSADIVDQHSDSVWYFNASGQFGSISVYLNDARPKYIVSLKRHSWFQDLLGKSEAPFRVALVSLEVALVALGCRYLTWFKTHDAADRPYRTIEEVMRA